MWLALLVFGCSGDDATDTPSDGPSATGSTGSTGDTGTVPPTGGVQASCALSGTNTLRAWCSVTLPTEDTVRIEVWPTSDPSEVHTFQGDGAATTHEVLVWGLRADTTWSWRVVADAGGSAEGRLATGSLPPPLSVTFEVDRVSDDTRVDGLLMVPGCASGWIVITDPEGRVVWYQSVEEAVPLLPPAVAATSLTEEGTILLGLAKLSIVELDLDGRLLMRLDKGHEFDDYVHHDLFRRDGITWALGAERITVDSVDYVADRIYAFDAAGTLVDQVHVEDLIAPVGAAWMLDGYWGGLFPGAFDFTHSNSIFADTDGSVYVSFRHLHSIAKLRGGAGTSTFGELEWLATGDPSSPVWPGDLALSGEPGVDPAFAGQHDVRVAANGDLLMLDNGFGGGATARAVRWSLDEGSGTLHAVEDWETDLLCATQGAVREVADQHLLVTCPTAGKVMEFAPGREQPLWSMTADCGSVFPAVVPRAIPIALP